MIEFVCPGCLSSHAANEAFAGLRARCVVCGAFLRIPAEGGGVAEVAEPPRATAARRSAARSASMASRTLPPASDDLEHPADPDDQEELYDDEDRDADLDEPVHPSAPARRRPTATEEAEASTWDFDDDERADDTDTETDNRPSRHKAEEPAEPPAEAQARKRKMRITAGALGGVLLLGVVCYFAFTGDEKKPLPPVSELPRQEPKRDEPKVAEPPKKKEQPKPPPPPVAVAPPPRPAGPGIPFTAARLRAERADAPPEFDIAYGGKRLLIRGTVRQADAGQVALADSPDEIGAIIHCSLLNPTKSDGAKSPPLQPGRPVTIRGTYTANLRLAECEVVSTAAPGDDEFAGRVVELTGIVRSTTATSLEGRESERFPVLVLEPPTTDCPLSIRCLFRQTESEKLTRYKPGQVVTVRGECEGREFRVVRLHNCTIPSADDPIPPTLVRVAADRLFAAFEPDLLPAPRPDPAVAPVAVAAEELAAAFDSNPRQANADYRYRSIQVTGRVIERHLQTRMIVFETGTNQRLRIQAVFTSARFAIVKEKDEAVMTVRGVCVGVRGSAVRIENCDRLETAAVEPDVPRTTADYLPFNPRGELTYDVLTPARPKDNPILRLSVRFAEPDLVRATPVKTGTFPGATLFGDRAGQPRWTKDIGKQKAAPQVTQYRASSSLVELRDVPAPPAQPSSSWDPALKLGMKKGETWSGETPDGRTVTYTVVDFSTDAQKRQLVQILRVTKNPKDLTSWEETTHVYARGVGEVRRVVTRHFSNGKAVALLEVRLVDPAADPKEPAEK
jgi:hypothetical protein